MGKLPDTITELCGIEKISVKSYTTNNKNKLTEVVAKDGREFVIFNKKIDAFKYAVKMFVDTQDDPQYLEQIKWTGSTVKQFAEDLIDREDVPYTVSYDQHHKVILSNNAIAYRTF